jgi:hypothetical protein
MYRAVYGENAGTECVVAGSHRGSGAAAMGEGPWKDLGRGMKS